MRISDWSSDVCSSDLGQEVDADFMLEQRVDAAALHARRRRNEKIAAGDHETAPDILAQAGVGDEIRVPVAHAAGEVFGGVLDGSDAAALPPAFGLTSSFLLPAVHMA